MMRKILASCLLVIKFSHSQSTEWFQGAVVLNSKEILSGKISVNLVHDLLLFHQGDKVSVYRAQGIIIVNYF